MFLLRNTITLILHAVEKLDATTTNESDWQQKVRARVFDNVKKALHSWIVDKNVVGGENTFGGTVCATENNCYRKELQVCHVLIPTIYSNCACMFGKVALKKGLHTSSCLITLAACMVEVSI